jgi:Bacterial Ig domain
MPTLTFVSSNTFLLGNLGAYSEPLGAYQVALDLSGVQDLAGNQSSHLIIMAWLRDNTNLPPAIAALTNIVMFPDGTLSFQVAASDPNGDSLSYSLGPGSPPTATIVATNGLFSWTPTRAYAETTNFFTVAVSNHLARSLIIYGNGGTNYQVQFTTNLANPAWQSLTTFSQTNGVITLQLDESNPTIFYRLMQQ